MRVRAALLAVLVLALLLFPAAASADYAHVIQPGETLTSVAATDGLSIEAIANANRISPQTQLIAGQTLLIPPLTSATAATGTASTGAAATSAGTTDDAGATGSQVATGTASTGAESADPDADGDTDTAASAATETSRSASTTGTAGTASTDSATTGTATTGAATSAGPVPTPERVDSVEIAGVADANAVPAALAEAIAWQESGWNNDEVSSVGAVGVMQIVPTTWTWIDRYLTPSDPLGTASASENIRAGVLLLHQLLALTGGNEQLAVAGYYQGLASVRRYGMYPSTRQYVADVMALAQRF